MLITKQHMRIWDNAEIFIHVSVNSIGEQRTGRVFQSNRYYTGQLIHGIFHKLMNPCDTTGKTISGQHCWKANKKLHLLLDRNLPICSLNVGMVSFYSLALVPTVPFSLNNSYSFLMLTPQCVQRQQAYSLSLFVLLGKTSLFHLFSAYKIDCHSPAERQGMISSRAVLLRLHSF